MFESGVRVRTLFAAGLLGSALFGAGPASATAIADASLSFHDISIIPASGTVLFTGPWILEAQAHADNSLGEFADDFKSAIGPGSVTATAAVKWAYKAHGAAADPDPTPPYLDIGAATEAHGHIPGKVGGSAIAKGRGTIRRDDPFLPSYFEITGGTPGDPVSVTFGVLIDYALNVTTDDHGVLAEAEVSFAQELFGDDVGFVLVNDFFDVRRIGPSAHADAGPLTVPLANTLELHYGTLYALLMEADAEIRVVNIPELDMSTGAGAWVMIWLVLLWRHPRVADRPENPDV